MNSVSIVASDGVLCGPPGDGHGVVFKVFWSMIAAWITLHILKIRKSPSFVLDF